MKPNRVLTIFAIVTITVFALLSLRKVSKVSAQACLPAEYKSVFQWQQGVVVQYSFEPNGAGAYKFYLTPNMQTAFANGAQEWNGRGTTQVTFAPSTGSSGPAWLISNCWGVCSINVKQSGGQTSTWTFDTSGLSPSTVASTYYIPDRNASGQLTGYAAAALTLINTNATASNGAPGLDPNSANFLNAMQALGAHESGHGFGLGDQVQTNPDGTTTPRCGDVMSPFSGTNNQGGCSTSTLTSCDDAEITSNPNGLYRPPPPSSCPNHRCPAGGGDPIDYCLYPDTGCPPGEQISGYCCQPPQPSPVIIDLSGNGFLLTSAQNGVLFDISGRGHPIQMGWTASGASNAFLALPGADGLVHNGLQLFGDFTSQPPSSTPNGFAALAVYDWPMNGGNGDGVIDARDAVFASLRLWIDANHDGISQPNELYTLPSLGVTSISLNYKLDRRTDQYGNVLRYRAQVNPGDPASVGRMAYDVFFVTLNPTAKNILNVNPRGNACGVQTIPVKTNGGMLTTSGLR